MAYGNPQFINGVRLALQIVGLLLLLLACFLVWRGKQSIGQVAPLIVIGLALANIVPLLIRNRDSKK